MNENVDPVAANALPTRSMLNPRAPRGALAFRPRDVAYVVEAPVARTRGGTRLWVVTSATWLSGWNVGKRVNLVTPMHAVEVVIRGIMDFGTATVEGTVPNLRIPHWRVENPRRRP